jgi:hypothetical protein
MVAVTGLCEEERSEVWSGALLLHSMVKQVKFERNNKIIKEA